uniref:Transposase MuDR plant domain-containing protein n=1 Tax=Lactuca sativa TaxID=4236 RepID=A0A9R1VGF5_LACSA|nr:hypothetical protein LSAT_V11C500293500 [Lactuca sativa]
MGLFVLSWCLQDKIVAITLEFEMGSSYDGYDGPFAGIYEPFSRLNEMDFELHGIYMDHEPKQESITRLNKSKDPFLNILLSDENIIISSMADEVKARVYHGNDLQNDEEAEEVVTNNYKIHDPNVRWDKIEPKLGVMFESSAQLKFYVTNYAVNGGIMLQDVGKRNEDNKCPFRLYVAYMYNERTFQVKEMNSKHLCSRVFKFRHYVTEIANKPKVKLMEMISDIKQKYRCVVSIGNRFYICFKSLSVCWKMGRRRVIGLDGCFIKDQVKSELLTSISRDATNQDDLDLSTGADLVVISDQHKGLLEYVKDASMSFVEGEFLRNMETLKSLNPNAHEYLMSTEPKTWCRAYMSAGYACQAVKNGIS